MMDDHEEIFKKPAHKCKDCIKVRCHNCKKSISPNMGYYCDNCYKEIFPSLFDYDDD